MAAHSIIDLLEKKEALYTELLALMAEESQALNTIALERLWGYTKEKNRLSTEIEGLRSELFHLASQRLGLDDTTVPVALRELPRLFCEEAAHVSRSVEAILRLKGELKVITTSSRAFVTEYLETVEEIIGILTTQSAKTGTYGMNRHLMETRSSLFLRGEA